MSRISAFLIPDSRLNSDECKELCQALLDWLEAEQTVGEGAYCDGPALSDLSEGELPAPLALRAIEKQKRLTKESQEFFASKGGDRLLLTPEEELQLEWESDPPAPNELKMAREQLGELAQSRGIQIGSVPNRLSKEEFLARLRSHVRPYLIESVQILRYK